MILVRIVFRVRQGQIRQVVDAMKQATVDVPNQPRILTDLSGPFNTLVMETRYASLAAAEEWRNAFFQSQDFKDREAARPEWIETGSTEYYTIEQE
jgi:hypothetical protein